MQLSEPSQPPIVTMHIWGVRGRKVPAALLRMARHRRPVRTTRGNIFAKLLGTGSGTTFSLRDADLNHWAILACWDSISSARMFDRGHVTTSWNDISFERCHFVLSPLASRGSWSGSTPFEPFAPVADSTRIAAITRARIRISELQRFARFVPPVAEAVNAAPGLQLRTGIGEAPVGLQGTFSVWRGQQDLAAFAYGREHRVVIDETKRSNWYAEELFARFAVLASGGTFAGQPVVEQKL